MSKYFKLFIILFLLFTFLLFILNSYVFADDLSNDDNMNTKEEIVHDYLSYDLAATADDTIPTTNSRSAVIIDRDSQTILYGKNQFNKVKMASTTKIMTAIVVIENANLQDVAIVSKKAASTRWFTSWIENC